MTRTRIPIPSRLGACALAALLAGGGNAFAQGPASAPGGSTRASGAMGSSDPNVSIAPTDRAFVQKAAVGGMAEVALGQTASQRARDPQVKQFGERMVTDHGKANDELKQLAASRGLQLPAAPDRAHQRDADRLGKLSGADFDRAYMKHMLDDHKKTVSEFEKASRSAKDPQVKDFATRTLPTLQSHLQLAQTTYDAVHQSAAAAPGAASGASR